MSTGPQRRKRVPLTKQEKADNVKFGMTPAGKMRVPKTGVKGTKSFPVGDYRCRRTAFDAKRKNDYLRVVREWGEEAMARAEVGVSYDTVQDHKGKDEVFKFALDEAYRQYASVLAKEIHRRAVIGVSEPVFGSQGPGSGSGVVGFITRFSDRLLIEQTRRHNKEYTPQQVVTQTTTLKGKPSLGLDKLSAESREDLKRILERESVNATDLEPTEQGDE